MSRGKFSRALKRSICIEYMQSGMSRKEIALKYNLPSTNLLSAWIQSCLSPLEIHEKCASLPRETVEKDEDMAKKVVQESVDQTALIEAQRKQIEKLEKQLKFSQDKVLALNTLIDVIEEQGIKVRKKAGVNVDAVKQIRQMDPGIGYYKLWLMSKRMFLCDWVPGRDAFLQLMRDFQLMQKRPKPRHTTNSNHRFRMYKNLIRGFVPTRPNQLWVSDITYIDLVDDCCYLHLVTDAYSHKIVGWCLSDTLEAEHTLEALRMAISQATADELRGLIHHSDRGVQYCCNAYTDELKKYGIKISMTEDYKPTDNAIAERVNGILKTEVIYHEKRFKTYQDALERISGFIAFYNDTRPHSSIGMKTPSEVHQEQGPQRIMWKTAKELSGAVCPLPQGTP